MALLTCKNVSLAYEGKTVVSDLSFKVEEKDYLCIIGENGSGKSTLIAGLLGLKKTASGSIAMGDGLRQTEIGYLPQQTDIQRDFPASVYEVVLSGCLNSGSRSPFYTKKNKLQAFENMERLGVSNLKNDCYKELSGGQQQRVLLARTLCAAKRLLVLDEPFAGLDPLVSGELYQLIRTINQEMKFTIIMVSHDIRSAVEHATMILHLHQKPLFFGRASDYIQSELGRKFAGGYRDV